MASKVQLDCIRIAVKSGKGAVACKIALRACRENNNEVYLPNAFDLVAVHGVTSHQWAGYLSVLAKEGFYTPIDDCFGEIKPF